jgi:penicillin-binding protein 1A
MMFGDDPEPQVQSNWRGPSGLRLPFYRRAWFSALLALTILAGVAIFGVIAIIITPLQEMAEEFDLDELKKLEAASIIFDRNGDELSRIYVLNRTPVPIKDIPQHFIDALTAQEDSRYFHHNGVDYIGLSRAVWLNFRAGEVTQGASTITQQLARQTFNLKERSYKRKLLEAFVAQRIERNFSKTEILEMYVNRIFFGANFYGIQAAARGYFGKDAKDLTLNESAVLAGLIKSPNNIQPIKNPQRAMKERDYVLDRMVIEEKLTYDEALREKAQPIITVATSSDPRLSYVVEDVRKEVIALVGEERASIGGFMIYTSIDRDLQRAAEASVRRRLAEIEKREGYPHQTYSQFREIFRDYRAKQSKGQVDPATNPRPMAEYLQGAALVMDNSDGSILAMVGGRDFIDSQYNRATTGSRPVGTAFTPFVYAAAFSRPDFYPMSQLEDAPLDNRRIMIGGTTGILGEWGAEVDNPQWSQARISAREALVKSHNSAAVRVGERVALEGGKITPQFLEFAKQAGIKTPLRDYPSTFLGASEVKLDEMTLAYSNFPTLGKRPPKLHLIQRITDSADKTVFQLGEEALQPVRAMDEIAAYQTHSCLEDALRRGTGAPSGEYGLGDFPAAGKTGTHYEFKDLWFFGYTSAVTCGVWVGFDKQKTIYPGAFSNRVVLPIWTDIINASAQAHAPQEIHPPESAEKVEICRKSGLRATDFCYEKVRGPDRVEKSVRNTYFEYLRPESQFNLTCNLHSGEGVPADLQAFHQNMTAGLSDSAALAQSAKFAHIQPVHVRDATIVGIDPYNSEQPILRARPVNEDGTPILRAQPVDPAEGEMAQEEPALKLKPPPGLKIEF